MSDQFFHTNTKLKLNSGEIESIREQCICDVDQEFDCCSQFNDGSILINSGIIIDKYTSTVSDTYIFSNGATLKCSPECKFMTSKRLIKPISKFTDNDTFFTVNYRNGFPISEELLYDGSQAGYLHLNDHVRITSDKEELFIQVQLKHAYKNLVVSLNNYTGILAFPFNHFS